MVATTDIEKVWFIVSPHNPLKKSKSLLHEFDRLDMVRAATFNNYDLDVSDVEFNLPKPSYTVDTMTYISEKHPGKEFILVIGEDNLSSFHRWKNHEQILENYSLYVYPRPDSVKSTLIDHPNIELVDAPRIDISATFIRNCVKRNQSVRYLVPDPVEEMIRVKKFYLN